MSPSFTHHVVCGLALLQTLVAGFPLSTETVPSYFQTLPISRRSLSVNTIQQDLGKILSKNTTIFGPSNTSAWETATDRWNTLAPPKVEIVVRVGEESDVSKVVKYCNNHSIEFLATNQGHGLTTSLGKFDGLEIDLQGLDNISIQPGGKTAILQGGTFGSEIMTTLWDAGYVTTTGSNQCVGFLGPALGGGHGRYEGLYGLVSDNFVNLNVVLADGSKIVVNKSSYSDLWWALQGAGHNFAIVTSAEVKIYPKEIDTWHYHNYIWSQEKLETVFEALNKFTGNGTTPPKMGVNFGQISFNDTISKTEAVIWWSFAYAGPAEEAEEILKPFNAIETIDQWSGDVPYPEIPVIQLTSVASGSCASETYALSTVLLQTYNITTERENYNYFMNQSALYPELAATARLYYEGYATKGMTEVPADSTAYPHRDEYHILFFLTAVPQGSNLLEPGQAWANQTKDVWNAGQPTRQPTTYINYATGDESLESVYGYQPWRLERLRSLKAKYDPHNRFGYYVPIIPKS